MSVQIQKLTSENFKSSIAQGVTLVDFYAEWCAPCRRLVPILEQLASQLEESQSDVKFFKVDIEAAQDVTNELNVTSVPTLILFKNGQEVNRKIGLQDLQSLAEFVKI